MLFVFGPSRSGHIYVSQMTGSSALSLILFLQRINLRLNLNLLRALEIVYTFIFFISRMWIFQFRVSSIFAPECMINCLRRLAYHEPDDAYRTATDCRQLPAGRRSPTVQ